MSPVHPLHLMCGDSSKRSRDALNAFLQRGDNPDIKGPEGLTPLHVASLWGNVEAVRLLLYFGANIDMCDSNGQNAVDMAQREEHESCVLLLKSWKAAKNPVKESYYKSAETESDCSILKMKSIATTTHKRKGRLAKFFSPILSCIKPDHHNVTMQLPSWTAESEQETNCMATSNKTTNCVATSNKTTNCVATSNKTTISDEKLPENDSSPRIYPEIPKVDENAVPEIDPALLKRCQKLSTSELRAWLEALGYDIGPITQTTRWLYDKKLAVCYQNGAAASSRYSNELQLALRGELNLSDCSQLEHDMTDYYDKPENQAKKWREGRQKMSFCYLLMDPNVTKDLPRRIGNMTDKERFQIFVDAIFYVGKGKKSRPYQHFKDAIEAQKKTDKDDPQSCKMRRIVDLWVSGLGVVSVHVFHNIIPVDAFSREACIIDAIGLSNLTNEKRGDYYGLTSTWNDAIKRKFGVYLLRRALTIYLAEGQTQLMPRDITSDC